MADSDPKFKAVLSEPPQVKIINAWAALGAVLISNLLEVVVCSFAWNALLLQRLDSIEFLGVVSLCVAGPAIGKARGKIGDGALSAIVATGAQIAQRSGKL